MTTARVFQREMWDGAPRELAAWWTLRRDATRGEAVCRMFTHLFGHELRLEVRGELVASQVCRSDDEVLTCQETWRAGLQAKGWSSRNHMSVDP